MVVEIIIICLTAIIIVAGFLGCSLYVNLRDQHYEGRISDLIKTVEKLREENASFKAAKAAEIQKATEAETAAFFDILKDPTSLYEED